MPSGVIFSDGDTAFYSKMGGVTIGQISRMVTIVDGVQVIEVRSYGPDGDPVETYYRVKGESFETLRRAMKAARGDR